MSFTMTHLIVSRNISEIFADRIESLPQFYLGSIAPDAVHNRAGYIPEYKKTSHLITGTEKWGMTTDNDEWKNNAIAFLTKYRKSKHHDFALGYCSHVLADIYNNVNVWTPFRIKHDVDIENGYDNIHHQESHKIDVELALTYAGSDDFWVHLANSNSIDLPGIIYAEEIDKQRDYILHSWYESKERPDLSLNKMKTYEGEMDFIEKATEFVAQIFREQFESD